MCVACLEFIKEKLTLKEYQSALWEVTREDEEHLSDVQRILTDEGRDPARVREKLRDLNPAKAT